MMLRNLMGVFLSFLLFAGACTSDNRNNVPDVSDISLTVSIYRFEQALFSLDTTNLENSFAELQNKYPEVCDFYFPVLLGMNKTPPGTPDFLPALRQFLLWPEVQKLYDTCTLIFPELTPYENELSSAFKYFSYYFPDEHIPKIYSVITEYMGAVIIPPNEDAIYLGLDMFLGPSYPIYYYHPLNLPRYITKTLKPEYISSRVVESHIDNILGPPPGSKLLDEIIHNGKKMFILDKLLPLTADTLKWGFTAEQMEWCYQNEAQIWQFFLEKDLLYSTDYQNIRKYISQSPNSPGMPPEAPGRTGNFIGYRILQQFMSKNQGVDFPTLVQLNDAQEILNLARYRPSNASF